MRPSVQQNLYIINTQLDNEPQLPNHCAESQKLNQKRNTIFAMCKHSYQKDQQHHEYELRAAHLIKSPVSCSNKIGSSQGASMPSDSRRNHAVTAAQPGGCFSPRMSLTAWFPCSITVAILSTCIQSI